LVGSSYTGF